MTLNPNWVTFPHTHSTEYCEDSRQDKAHVGGTKGVVLR